MRVEFKYFGQIAERLGKASEELNIPSSTNNIRDFIVDLYPELIDASFCVAINYHITDEWNGEDDLKEVALLPPFAGG